MSDTGPYFLQTWDEKHPIFAPFADPQHGDLRRISFRKIARLSVKPAEGAKILVAAGSGEPLLVEKRSGNGKVLVFASAAGREWSDWPQSRLYVPIVHQMMAYLTGRLPEDERLRSELAGSDDEPPGITTSEGKVLVRNLDPAESQIQRCSETQFRTEFQLGAAEAAAELKPAAIKIPPGTECRMRNGRKSCGCCWECWSLRCLLPIVRTHEETGLAEVMMSIVASPEVSSGVPLVGRVERVRHDCSRFLVVRTALWLLVGLLIVGGVLALADWIWVLPPTLPLAVWLLLGLAATIGWCRALLSRRPLNRGDTAADIEKAFPELGQRVCTTLEYAEPTPQTMPAWPSLVHALMSDTEQRTAGLAFDRVVPWRTLRRPGSAAAVLVCVFSVMLLVSPEARIAAMRLFLIPVNYTQLEIEPGDHAVRLGAVSRSARSSRDGRLTPWILSTARPERKRVDARLLQSARR